MNKKIIAVVQARMDSSRLPGKSLLKIGNWAIIELVMERIKQSSEIDDVVLATSINPKDDVLADYIQNKGFKVFRGSEEDVLSRFYNSVKNFKPDAVLRVTGDCPLISPKLIDMSVKKFNEMNVDYFSLAIGETKERAFPRGFDVEIASFAALTEAMNEAEEKYEREHVMPFLYTNEDRYTTYYLEPPQEHSRPGYRLCVDTQEDYETILKIYTNFQEKLINTDFVEIISFLDDNPEVAKSNQTAKQKHFTETDKRMR